MTLADRNQELLLAEIERLTRQRDELLSLCGELIAYHADEGTFLDDIVLRMRDLVRALDVAAVLAEKERMNQ